jgi:ABC-type uncharacterized transport system substrate-binding protein
MSPRVCPTSASPKATCSTSSPSVNRYQKTKRQLRLPPMKTKSKKQVGFLLSKGSPLSKPQQSKLKKELHSGAVKVKKTK